MADQKFERYPRDVRDWRREQLVRCLATLRRMVDKPRLGNERPSRRRDCAIQMSGSSRMREIVLRPSALMAGLVRW